MSLPPDLMQFIQNNIGTMTNEEILDAARAMLQGTDDVFADVQADMDGHSSAAPVDHLVIVARPWVGDDGRLVDQPTGTRYAWEDE